MKPIRYMPFLSLMQLSDTQFPIGGFSHSFGLETEIQAGLVKDASSLYTWLNGYLYAGLVAADGLAVSLVMEVVDAEWSFEFLSSTNREQKKRGTRRYLVENEGLAGSGEPLDEQKDDERLRFQQLGDQQLKVEHLKEDGFTYKEEPVSRQWLEKVREFDQILTAAKTPAESRQASLKMGRNLYRIALDLTPSAVWKPYWEEVKQHRKLGHHAVAYALVAAGWEVEREAAVAAFLYQSLASLNFNAVRAIPLGQQEGQYILHQLMPDIIRAKDLILQKNIDHFCVQAPSLDFAAMEHERLYSRLFMS